MLLVGGACDTGLIIETGSGELWMDGGILGSI